MDVANEAAANVPRSAIPSYASTGIGETAPLTDKQKNFIFSLVAERDLSHSGKTLTEIREMISGLSRTKASEWIARLLELPKLADRDNDVPAGRYAIQFPGLVRFYKVDRPTEGKWAGWTFVKIQAGDEHHSVNDREFVLNLIREAGVRESMELYGRELGSCGHCGRTLTNEESRARGIGPVCAGRMGF